MKRVLIAVAVLLSLTFACVALADKGVPAFKKGDTVYVCACGEGCDCLTMARKDGKCTCGRPLAKTTVDKVEAEKVFVKVDGKERAFTAKAKYACACGEGCDCGTVSQKPGKCTCGKDMKKVE